MSRHGKILRLALAIFVLVVFLGCPQKITTPPDQLLGTWKTISPKYADNYLEITPDQIIFGTGGQSSLTYQISYLKEDPQETYTLYTIFYLDQEEHEYQISFFYNPEQKGIIRMKNEIEIDWTRKRAKK